MPILQLAPKTGGKAWQNGKFKVQHKALLRPLWGKPSCWRAALVHAWTIPYYVNQI